MDPYEAELADLNTDLNTLQKEVDELSERFAEKKNSALAAKLYEEVLKSAEKELYTCRTNYEIDQEKWKNKEAKYNQELEQIEKDKADLKSELQTWKDATEEAVATLENIAKERDILRDEKVAWTKKEKVYQQYYDVLNNTRMTLQAAVSKATVSF